MTNLQNESNLWNPALTTASVTNWFDRTSCSLADHRAEQLKARAIREALARAAQLKALAEAEAAKCLAEMGWPNCI